MRRLSRLRALLPQFALRVILPLTTMIVIVIAAGLFAYQRTLTSLLLERDRQLATLAADRIAASLDGSTRTLEALATHPDVLSDSSDRRAQVLSDAADVLEVFNAGAAIVDDVGALVTAYPVRSVAWGDGVGIEPYFVEARERLAAAYSDVRLDPATGAELIMIAAPIVNEDGAFSGALIGSVDLRTTPLGEPVRQLVIGDGGFAYVIDANGRVIFHPERERTGADLTDRPFAQDVRSGNSAAELWTSPEGERLVVGYAPLGTTGWRLVVREPWATAVAPAQIYALIITAVGLAAIGAAAYLLWRGVQRIAAPIHALAGQAARIAVGDAVPPLPPSDIHEIDALARAFSDMATKIARYRAGLRRYLGSVTRSQEEERRRLARELHDETAQGLLAVARRIELHESREADAARRAQLSDLHAMVVDVLDNVRRIGRDLRPPVLEDLGLVPALTQLVIAAREGEGAVPQTSFELVGQPRTLSPEQELALYRITQEALTNIRKHARATGLQVRLVFMDAAVRLEIDDDGVGFTLPSQLADLAQLDKFGMMGIQERVWAIGGELAIASTPGQGTCLEVIIPLVG